MNREGKMRKLLFIVLLIAAFLNGAEAYGSDWKFYGRGDLPKGDAMIAYYDAESVKRLPVGHVSVWTKCIGLSEVERTVNFDEVIKKAARKSGAGYVPPYILSNPKPEPGYDVNSQIIVWEEAANYDVIKPKLKVFYELSCKAKKIRSLSTINYKNDGGAETRSDSDKWISIRPESNSETLRKILCKQRNVIK
jgi:hypothetical protein